MSTMELAAWCRWGLLLALLPSGAVGTQGGSGEGRARSGDATLQPGAPPRSLRAGGGRGGSRELADRRFRTVPARLAAGRGGEEGPREGGAGGEDAGGALAVPVQRLALSRLRRLWELVRKVL